jgi:signal peptidase I
VVNPVHYAAPEDDPDPTDVIPRVSAPGRPGETTQGRLSGRLRRLGDRSGRHRKPAGKQPLWREVLTLFGVALVLTFLIQHFLGRVYSIPSGSMEQTLHGCPGCTGDRVLVDKVIYRFRDPAPGDVIVFKGPPAWTEHDAEVPREGNALIRGLQQIGALVGLAPPDERDFVKRVIGTGGQTVACCDDNRVTVDGKPLDEPYVYWAPGLPTTQKPFPPVRVPAGALWVMGDNRNDSCDSRCQGGGEQVNGGINGVVPVDHVIGKARFIVLPPSRWQGIGDHNPQQGIAMAVSAPAWQQGLPAGIGALAAWPVWWYVGRRIRRGTVRPRGVCGDGGPDRSPDTEPDPPPG